MRKLKLKGGWREWREELGRHEGLTGKDAGFDIRVCWNGEDMLG